MTLEQNKALVRRFYEEVWINGNLEVAEEVLLLTTDVMICVQAIQLPARKARKESRLIFEQHFPTFACR